MAVKPTTWRYRKFFQEVVTIGRNALCCFYKANLYFSVSGEKKPHYLLNEICTQLHKQYKLMQYRSSKMLKPEYLILIDNGISLLQGPFLILFSLFFCTFLRILCYSWHCSIINWQSQFHSYNCIVYVMISAVQGMFKCYSCSNFILANIFQNFLSVVSYNSLKKSSLFKFVCCFKRFTQT